MRNPLHHVPRRRWIGGQAMTEYVIVCMLVAMVFIMPFDGKRLYVWVVDALRLMHKGYMAGISVYAYPF
jgi:hypothetical protein